MSAKATAGARRPGSLKRGEFRLCRVIRNGAGCIARRAGGGIEAAFELGDEVLDGVDLARKVRGALPLGVERLFRDGLLLLPFVDEQRQPKLLMPQQIEVPGEAVAFVDDLLAHAHQIGQIAGQSVGLRAHFRQHGAKRDRRAHGLERILRPHHERRRRLPPDALQGGEYFDNHVAALGERFTKQFFLLIEWLQASPRRVDTGLDVADSRGGADEILIKFATVLAQRLDLDPQLGLALHRIALAGERGVEFLIVLLERVDLIRRRCDGRGRRRGRTSRTLRGWRSCRGELRRRLGECDGIRAEVCADRQHKGQGRAEHKARIGAARASENHRVQG